MLVFHSKNVCITPSPLPMWFRVLAAAIRHLHRLARVHLLEVPSAARQRYLQANGLHHLHLTTLTRYPQRVPDHLPEANPASTQSSFEGARRPHTHQILAYLVPRKEPHDDEMALLCRLPTRKTPTDALLHQEKRLARANPRSADCVPTTEQEAERHQGRARPSRPSVAQI